MMFNIGDILRSSDTENASHPIIYFGEIPGSDDFYGCIISHSEKYSSNILMSKEHFEESDENGDNYHDGFNKNTHLVRRKLIKSIECGSFTKTGRLTQAGILFVEDSVHHLKEERLPGR